MDREDKTSVLRELKDLASELKSIRNSVLVLNLAGHVAGKSRELELVVKGAIFEIEEFVVA